MRSHSGPIHVLLVNKDSDGASPVVVQVPPIKEEMVMNPHSAQAAITVKPNTAQKSAKVIIIIIVIIISDLYCSDWLICERANKF